MQMTKSINEATQDLTADLTALREDIAKLTNSVTTLVRSQAVVTTDQMLGAVDTARQKISDTAAGAQNRVSAIGSDLESAVERNPLAAIAVAMSAGILIGLMTRRK